MANHARDNDIVSRADSGFGIKYVVECHLETPDGRDPCITTIWIDEDDDRAKLITAYPK